MRRVQRDVVWKSQADFLLTDWAGFLLICIPPASSPLFAAWLPLTQMTWGPHTWRHSPFPVPLVAKLNSLGVLLYGGLYWAIGHAHRARRVQILGLASCGLYVIGMVALLEAWWPAAFVALLAAWVSGVGLVRDLVRLRREPRAKGSTGSGKA